MRTLAMDPGTRYTGWAVLQDGEYADSGIIEADGALPWPQRLRALRAILVQLVACHAPDLVCIEHTQVHEGLWAAAKDDPAKLQELAPRLRAQARATRQTEELCGVIMEVAAQALAVTVRPSDTDGLRALGLKRGATDRAVSEAANRLFGLRLLVKEHHEARAIGIGLAGAARLRLRKAGVPA